MSNNVVKAYYSRKTGKRVTITFAERNPNYIETYKYSLDLIPKGVVLDKHGIPATMTGARLAEAAWKTKEAKLAARRAKYAADKLDPKKRVKKAVKKVAKKIAQKIHKSAVDGKIVSAAHAKANPDTTYATKAKRVKKVLPPIPTPMI